MRLPASGGQCVTGRQPRRTHSHGAPGAGWRHAAAADRAAAAAAAAAGGGGGDGSGARRWCRHCPSGEHSRP